MTTKSKSGELFCVWCPDYGEDEQEARRIKSFCHEAAVTDWAEWIDRLDTDYSIATGNSVRVCVRREGSEEIRHYIVSGECVYCYRATLVE